MAALARAARPARRPDRGLRRLPGAGVPGAWPPLSGLRAARGRRGRAPLAGGGGGASRRDDGHQPGQGRVNVFLWHVHGSYTTALVQGPHRYMLPVEPDRGPNGRGRARSWDWPASATEVDRAAAAEAAVDVVVLQRPEELTSLTAEWLGGRRPGIDVPAVYLEHNTPPGPNDGMRHPAADQDRVPIVHVTHCNALFWDAGRARTVVVEHGVVDPGHRYSGELPRAAVVVNDPVRRGRPAGAGPLDPFRRAGGPPPLRTGAAPPRGQGPP